MDERAKSLAPLEPLGQEARQSGVEDPFHRPGDVVLEADVADHAFDLVIEPRQFPQKRIVVVGNSIRNLVGQRMVPLRPLDNQADGV